MNTDDLRRANAIQREIKRIEGFLFYAERVWTGKIIKMDTKYIFKSNAYGALKSKELELNTELKDKMLEVLREYLRELKAELDKI